MLISPTEPPSLRAIGKVSSMPERFGVDVLMNGMEGTVGVQRKEIRDFVASVGDGRLQREVAQMKELDTGIIVLEGRALWRNGLLTNTKRAWTLPQHLGVLWSLQSRGFWIVTSDNLTDTIQLLSLLEKWVGKERHSSLASRPKEKIMPWGNTSNRDWGVHILQGWDGISSGLAGAIYDWFGGLPLTWTVTENEMREVPGLGPKRVKKLYDSLRGVGERKLRDFSNLKRDSGRGTMDTMEDALTMADVISNPPGANAPSQPE